MVDMVFRWLDSVMWQKKLFFSFDIGLRFLLVLGVSLIIGKLLGKVMMYFAVRKSLSELFPFGRSLAKKDVYRRLAMMFPLAIMSLAAGAVFRDSPVFLSFFHRILNSILAAFALYTANAFINAVDNYYQEFEVSRTNPIKGYLQMIKIFITMSGIIVIFSILFNRSPWGILSGIGAMTALIILVFKDWILGLVASIQINANKLVVIGDSIEMEKHNINGEVVEIALSTVKIKNWDNTISMLPAYSLISETFKNWHGVKESGGRRIKRVLYIDISSINFPDSGILKRIKKLRLLEKSSELEELVRLVRKGRSERVNLNGITNIGLFRKYAEQYLVNHARVDSDKTHMVKLLEPSESGIPLQIYVFTKIVDVVEYEKTVAEIFEHLIAVTPEFGLRLFQNPAGSDFRKS